MFGLSSLFVPADRTGRIGSLCVWQKVQFSRSQYSAIG